VQSGSIGETYRDTATGYLYRKMAGNATTTGWYYAPQFLGAGAGLGPQTETMSAVNGAVPTFGNGVFANVAQTNNQAPVVFGTTWWDKSVTNSSTGTRGGWLSTVQPILFDNDFDISFMVRTHTTFTDGRIMLGLTSADLTNSDTLPGDGVVMRFSQGTDTSWVGCSRDGTTQTCTAAIGSISTSTNYNVRIRYIASGTPTYYFSVNDGAETTKTTNMARAGQNSGICLYIYNKNATTQNLMWRAVGITFAGAT
jgi:hypothetical protein